MSNYTVTTDFAAKDALATGNPAKLIKGSELTTEFNNLVTAVNSKSDTASPTFTGTVTLPSTTSIGNASATEIGYLDGVTSALQTQLDAKAPSASPTFTGTVTVPTSITGAPTFSGLVKARGGGNGLGQITISTAAASGGANGDLWYRY